MNECKTGGGMTPIADLAAAEISNLEATIAFLKANVSRFAPIESLIAERGYRVIWSCGELIVDLHSDSFPAAAVVLEEFETLLGIEFNDSHDYPQGGWRTFRDKAFDKFRIDVNLTNGSQNCRRVKVGVREEPIYEFRCDEPIAEAA